MTSTMVESEVLKQDGMGRVLVTKEKREALLDEFERSGLSGAGFARMTGVKYATLMHWRTQRRRKGAGPPNGGKAIQLLEASIEGEIACRSTIGVAGLVVDLPGGSRMRVESPSQLAMAAELVSLVARRASPRC